MCLTHPEAADTARIRASVLMVHGYGEHMGRYDEVTCAWTRAGFSVGRFDLRGHGQSGGLRGHVRHFGDYTLDLARVLAELARDPLWAASGRPIVFGHSLGALIAVHYALEHQTELQGLAMTSPFFELARPVPSLKRALAQTMSLLWPSYSQPNGIAGGCLTRDTELAERHARDPLVQRRVTARWYVETARAQRVALQLAPRLRLPVVCLAAGEDRIAGLSATAQFFERIGATHAKLDILQGSRHEVLNELDRDTSIAVLAHQFGDWAEYSGRQA
ncbi:alpha/beta hydrolase [Myxococcota bacterium]